MNRKRCRNQLLKLGKPEFVKRMIPEMSEQRVWVKFSLLLAALCMLILMLARPQMGMRMRSTNLSGIEVVVAMDVSNSMLADDVTPTRLDKAKDLVSSLCNRLRNDKVALVAFAGNAFLQMPMSADNVSVNMFLDEMNTGMIPTQGTSIAEALSVSEKSFSKQKDVKRAVVLITDGEDHEGSVDEILAELKSKGIKVYVMGIGSPNGSTIKCNNELMIDAEGNIVVTKLNEDMCRNIAKTADGIYIHIDNSNSAQDQIVKELNALQRSTLETDAYEEYAELFPWIALVVLLLLVVEIFIQPRKSHYFDSWNLFSVHKNATKSIVVIAMLSLSLGGYAQSQTKVQTHKGNVSFFKNLDSLSVIYYKKAIALDSLNYKAHYNLGNTYLRQGKAQDAMKQYEKAANCSPAPIVKSQIYHNIGVIQQASRQYEKAIDAYKKSLRANPRDNQTRYNLALCQYLQKKNPQQNQQNQNKDQNKDKQDQQQQQQNKDKQQQNQQNQQKQNQQQQQQMSKQNAEQMLQAVRMKERETQQKLKDKKVPATRRQLDKNW